MEKKKLLFKIIGAMTLALPISITLVVSAIWSKPTPDYVITFNDALAVDLETINEKVVITEHDDKNKALVIAFDEFTFYNIDFTYYDKIIDGKYIVKNKSYIRFLSDDFDNVLEIIDGDPFIKLDKVSHINIQTGNKLSLSLIVSIIATLVVVGIISGKMKLHRKYPKSATFIALLSATIIIGVIKAIIGSIFTVFVVATISWGAYCLEDAYFKSLQPVSESQQQQNALIDELRRLL
ncbi:MAG: hypothetical protein BWX74_00947 [Tenericutes bacterium ADurb.Bin087]|nr:MAG: hypothetical protein BWX74_00947 [Tenericutes bacterium ADurb.Bin087]HPN61571.1 hypothetical protein [Bacilli bacterium]